MTGVFFIILASCLLLNHLDSHRADNTESDNDDLEYIISVQIQKLPCHRCHRVEREVEDDAEWQGKHDPAPPWNFDVRLSKKHCEQGRYDQHPYK